MTLGGDLPSLDLAVYHLRNDATDMGLTLNDTKYEIICSSTDCICLPEQLRKFAVVPPQQATLLGVPLSTADVLTSALEKKISALELIAMRFHLLHAQDALLILRHSFSSPFIQHLLRGIFCDDLDLLRDYH